MNSEFKSASSICLTEIQDGIKEASPIIIAIIPLAVVFGAVAVEHGFSVSEVMLTSLSVYAAASQYVLLDLLDKEVSALVIVLSVFAVNFRHILYSASLGQKMQAFNSFQKAAAFFLLVDPQYAAAEARASRSALRPSFYFSYALIVYFTWLASNGIGAVFGSLIKNSHVYGIDFILPLYFIGLVIGFRKRQGFFPVLAVSASASLIVYFAIGSPWHITVGGFAGMVYAAATSKPPAEKADG